MKSKNTRPVTTYVEPEIFEKIEKVALDNKTSVTAWIRDLIEKGLRPDHSHNGITESTTTIHDEPITKKDLDKVLDIANSIKKTIEELRINRT